MHGTHYKNYLLIPLLVSNNNLSSLRCGYMCAETLVHISRHLGRTSNRHLDRMSNNNNRCQPIVHSIFCRVCFHLVLPRISGFMIITLFIPPYHMCSIPPASCSYLIIPCVFPAWYHLLYFYVLLLACAHNTVFNACLWFEFIDTCVLIFARHLSFTSSFVREFWLPWILISRFQRLELVDSSSCWSEMRIGSVDH